jgi:hypothetical protein
VYRGKSVFGMVDVVMISSGAPVMHSRYPCQCFVTTEAGAVMISFLLKGPFKNGTTRLERGTSQGIEVMTYLLKVNRLRRRWHCMYSLRSLTEDNVDVLRFQS